MYIVFSTLLNPILNAQNYCQWFMQSRSKYDKLYAWKSGQGWLLGTISFSYSMSLNRFQHKSRLIHWLIAITVHFADVSVCPKGLHAIAFAVIARLYNVCLYIDCSPLIAPSLFPRLIFKGLLYHANIHRSICKEHLTPYREQSDGLLQNYFKNASSVTGSFHSFLL